MALALIAVSAFLVGKARNRIESYRRKEEDKRERVEEEELEWLRQKEESIILKQTQKSEARIGKLRIWIQDAIEDWSEEGIRLIQSHKYSLAMERKRLTKVNPYGIVNDEEWIDEGLPSFVESVLMPSLEQRLKADYEVGDINEIDCFMDDEWRKAKDAFIHGGRVDWLERQDYSPLLSNMLEMTEREDFGLSLSMRIEEEVSSWCKEHIELAIQNLSSNASIENLSGLEYEDYCKEILVKHDWEVSNTKASGDQGVDLVAALETFRVCIQCKRSLSPVGNSAVQEVTAGKLYWHGTHAVVVTNAGFTKSARALARSTGVLLMSHEELQDLEKKLK